MTIPAKMVEEFLQFFNEKKNVIEDIMDVLQQGADILAGGTVNFSPFFEIAGPIVKVFLSNRESTEAAFMKEQFHNLHERLKCISEENKLINNEINKSKMKINYFPVQENIDNLFRKYMDILTTDPEYREGKKDLFMIHYDATGGETNLNTLYEAVCEESVLQVILECEGKSRRAMENFCTMLKELFSIGIIVVMVYTALKGYDEKEKLQIWIKKMEDVQLKMNTFIDDCKTTFAEQAKTDSECWVRECSALSNNKLAETLLGRLKGKYDWVCWSVRIFITSKWSKEFQFIKGKSYFEVKATSENVIILVSYSVSPEPLDKAKIHKLIQNQKKFFKKSTAELLFNELQEACVVHIFKTSEDLDCPNSFSEEKHYFKEYNNKYVCVHSF